MNERILADDASGITKQGPIHSKMRQLACSRCGVTLACGAQAGECWCQALPSLPAEALDPEQDCMCEACLLSMHIDAALNQKTMPRGALGEIGELAKQIGRIQKTLRPQVERTAVIVFAADHGVTEEGVSAYPKDVTWQMVENFRAGAAAINVLTRSQGTGLYVVDAGVDHDFAGQASTWTPAFQEHGLSTHFISQKIARGTANFAKAPAMSLEQAKDCITKGRHVTRMVIQANATHALGFGEMGIGNTTSAAALVCKLLNLRPQQVVGRGTGIDDVQLKRKQELVANGLTLHAQAQSPLEVLACLGGFEIGQMVGAMLEAEQLGQILVIDGFITSAAFLIAQSMEPRLIQSCVFAHQSQETGHALVLQALGVKPLLNLGLRLGEGSGAALVMPLLKSAAAILSEMASFASAGVSESAK
jgi:nicotinate-nucleotide--dimethylbenzimidazole phosphoribosyltransferase